MTNLKDLIVNGIVRLSTLIYGKDAVVKGGLNCGGVKVDGNSNSSDQPFYLNEGVITTGKKGIVDLGAVSSDTTLPSGSYAALQNVTQSGNRSIIHIDNGIEITTTAQRFNSQNNYFQIYLENPNVSGSATVLLTNKNWSEFIDLDDYTVEAGDGQVTVQYNGASLGSFNMNQSTNTTINVPTLVKYPSARLNSSWLSTFRTQTKGDSNSGSYISVQRCDTAGLVGAPQYGSCLAGGVDGTHFYISAAYSSREAYFGAGNANALNYRRRIAFKSDLPSTGSLMNVSASNSTKRAIHNIAAAGLTAWDGTSLTDDQTIFLNDNSTYSREPMLKLWECMRQWRMPIFQASPYYLPKAQLSNTWKQNDPTRYNRFWNVIESTTAANKDKVTDAVYHGNIQHCTPFIDLGQFRGNVQMMPNNSMRKLVARIDLLSPTQQSVLTTDSLNYIFIKPYFLNATTELVNTAAISVLIPPNTQWYVIIEPNNVVTTAYLTTIVRNTTSYAKQYIYTMDNSIYETIF